MDTLLFNGTTTLNQSVWFNKTFKYGFCKYHHQSIETSREFNQTAIFLPGGCGLIANMLVILLAAKYTVKKNLHHLIINMAVSDALVILIQMIYQIFFEYFHKQNKILQVFEFLYLSSMLVSACTLFIISIERFKATWFTVLRTRSYSLKRCLLVMAFSWVTSIAFSSYRILLHREEVTEIYLSCIYSLYATILYLGMFVLSFLTLQKLPSPHTLGIHFNNYGQLACVRRIKSAVRMVQYSLVLYSTCIFPLVCFNLLNSLEGLGLMRSIEDYCVDWPMIMFFVSSVLPVINSSFSPCVYFICLSEFRKGAKRLFYWIRKKCYRNRKDIYVLRKYRIRFPDI